MTFMPAELPTGLVTGRYAFVTVDDPKDADYDPDMIPVTGDVTFTISAQPPIRYDGPSGHIGTIPVRVKAFFDNEGYLVAGDGRGIELPATDSPLFNPTGFTWQVSFNLRDAKGNTKVHVPGFSFAVPEGAGLDGTTPAVDLVAITPVGSSNGTQITRGASAYEVALSNGFTGSEAEWLDSLEGTASDEDVAPLINGDTQTAAELSATYATNEYVGTLAYGTNLEATDATTATWVNDSSTDTGAALRGKFLAVMTPFAFGVVGDGVADDTAGLQAWLDAPGNYRALPEGEYRITAGLTSSEPGRNFSGPGNLVADTADIVMLRITGANTSVGSWFHIDGGNLASHGFSIEAGGCDIESTVIENLSSTTTTTRAIDFVTSGGGSARKNIIRNIHSTGDATFGNAPGFARGIVASSTTAATAPLFIEDNFVENITGEEGDGIAVLFFDGVSSAEPFLDSKTVIRNNEVKNCTRRYIKVQGSNTRVVGNKVWAESGFTATNPSHCITSYDSHAVSIDGNIVYGEAPLLLGIGVYGTSGTKVNNCEVINNRIIMGASTNSAVYADETLNLTIRGNRFEDGATCVAIGYSDYALIQGNTVVGGVATADAFVATSTNNVTVMQDNVCLDPDRGQMIRNNSVSGISLNNTQVVAPV